MFKNRAKLISIKYITEIRAVRLADSYKDDMLTKTEMEYQDEQF